VHHESKLPDDFDAQLVAAVGDKENATRAHSGAALQKAAEIAPWIAGGSADLAPSNNSMITSEPKDGEWPKSVGPGEFGARNFHFGVREHAMIAAVNGITLHGGFRAYGASFLIFTDYARAAIRLGSLMQVPAIYPFTHDSVFLGEDGPTHQPIEHYAALRAIPRLHFFRPADGLETAMSWAYALQMKKGPAIFGLTRQKLPVLTRPASFNRPDVWKGGYVILEPSGAPEAVAIATGSEVSITIAAAQALNAKGRKIRVVSMPCTTLFDAQDPAYRESVVPRKLKTCAVEAGVPMSWYEYVGKDGLVIGLTDFGESAPAPDIAKHFGFTPEAIAAKIDAWLK
jgi:transketolase